MKAISVASPRRTCAVGVEWSGPGRVSKSMSMSKSVRAARSTHTSQPPTFSSQTRTLHSFPVSTHTGKLAPTAPHTNQPHLGVGLDARVAARAVLVAVCCCVKQVGHQLLVVDKRERLPPRVEAAVLGQGDHLVNVLADDLGLDLGAWGGGVEDGGGGRRVRP